MLSENIKSLRKAKGISQEELAVRLNVVRQTISKWENGLSVPDAELLICLAQALDTSVNGLLGEDDVPSCEPDALSLIAKKLELINAELARTAARRRRTRIITGSVLLALSLMITFMGVVPLLHSNASRRALEEYAGIIGGADGPTSIVISGPSPDIPALLLAAAFGIIGIVILIRIRKG